MKTLFCQHVVPAAMLLALAGTLVVGGRLVAAEEQEVAAGQTVTGKLAVPAENAGQDINFTLARGILFTVQSPPVIPYPREDMSQEEKLAWQKEWIASEAGKAWIKEQQEARANAKRYNVQADEQGSFTIEDVAPGKYNLSLSIIDPTSRRPLGGARLADIVVADQAVELGDVPLSIVKYLKVGDDAPAVNATTLDGQELKLSDFRGKYVLIDFWATWCGPCIRETPVIKKVHQTYADRDDFAVIGFSIDKEVDLPAAYAKKNELEYHQAFLGIGEEGRKTLNNWGISGIPSIWLIGPDGKIVAMGLRGERMHEAVMNALEPEKAKAAAAAEAEGEAAEKPALETAEEK